MRGIQKDLFPGGNTAYGFFSRFDQIISPDAFRIIIVKGGPGVGKSSLMKAIADTVLNKGLPTEFHHCSSDPDSLDAVVFPTLDTAFIDGTSPHIVDPCYPGAVDTILHLGDFWDEKGIRQNKAQILEISRETGLHFQRAYHYLKAAKNICDQIRAITGSHMNSGTANAKASDLIESIFEGRPVSSQPGKIRRLFASAITPKGFMHFLPGIIDPNPIIYALVGPIGSGKASLLEKLTTSAVEKGFDCEVYCCGFDPMKIEHLVIPKLGVAVTTATNPHCHGLEQAMSVINMEDCLSPLLEKRYGHLLQDDTIAYRQLLDQAVVSLTRAKAVHDQLEQYYIPNMNFAGIDEVRERLTEKILERQG